MSTGSSELHPMRWWHLQDVAALERETFGVTAWSLEQFYAELAAPGRFLRVLVADGQVAGYVDVAVQGRDADLMTIAVAESARGRGHGAHMLSEAKRWAAEQGAHHMFLEVADDNPAQHLYATHGFTVLDRRHGYYGEGTQAVVMRAGLTRPGIEEEQRDER